jgi:hypothetical protein
VFSEEVKIGGTVLPASKLAVVDSGSSFLLGPRDAVAVIAQLEQVLCFNLDEDNVPEQVECDNEAGFDAAAIDCEQMVFNLDLVADGVTYTFGKEDLVEVIDTDGQGPICLLRIMSSFEFDGVSLS